MSHDDVRDLLGAYSVDAVDETERRAVELHLGQCAECRAEVGRHLEAASLLAAEPVTPPPEVWERIKTTVRGDALGVVRPLRRRPRRAVQIAAAVAVAAVATSVFLTVDAISDERRLRDRVDELAAAVADEGVEGAARAALLDPDAQLVTLRSTDRSLTADLVYLPDGTGYLVRHNLEPLPEGAAYQLWALVGGARISAGVLGRAPGVAPFTVRVPAQGFAITEEAATGAGQPSGDPVVVGLLV